MLLTTMFGICAHGLEEKVPRFVNQVEVSSILQRYVFAVVKFVATQQLRPRLPPETSKALITTHAGRLTWHRKCCFIG